MSVSSILSFAESNLSVWGPGNSTGFNWSFDKSFSTPFNKSWVLDLPSFIPDAYLSASLDAGIRGQVGATLGSFDLSYPIAVDAQFPDSVAAGQTFTIDTSDYNVNPASIDVTGPGLTAGLDIFIEGGVSLQWWNVPPVEASFDWNQEYGLDSADLDGSYGSLSFSSPAPFETSATLQGASASLQPLTATGQSNPFLTAELDLDQLARTFFPSIPKVDGEIDVPFVGEAEWDLLDIDLVGSLSLAQALTFQPSSVNIELSYAGQHQFGKLGDSFTFTAPNSGSGSMQIDAKYTLVGAVTTRTGIVGNALLSIEALKFQADLLGGHFSAGVEMTLPANGFSTGLQNWNSTASTFSDTIGNPYSVTYAIAYSDSTPPPPPPPPPSDDYPLESSQTAGRVPVNALPVQGTIEIPADRDWFRLDVTAGQHYRFELAGEASGNGLTLDNPVMSLRKLADPATKVLVADAKGQSAAFLDYTPNANETIFVVVGGDLKTGGTYSLKATTIGGTGIGAPVVGTPPTILPPPPSPPPEPPDTKTSAVFLSIADNSVREGDSGTTMLSFGVMLSGPGAGTRAVSVQYATEDIPGSSARAFAGQDYIAASSVLVIPEGQTSGTIDIKIFGDSQLELDEVFRLVLSQPSLNVTLLQDHATGFITNDDQPPNHQPASKKDIATTAPNTPVILDVLSNDFDPDGDALEIVEIYGVSNGGSAVATDNNQRVLVTPEAGFTGLINFVYVLDDGKPNGLNNGHCRQRHHLWGWRKRHSFRRIRRRRDSRQSGRRPDRWRAWFRLSRPSKCGPRCEHPV